MTGRAARKATIRGGVFEPLAHDSAVKHVTGEALYVDDVPGPPGTLHAAFGISALAHGRIKAMPCARRTEHGASPPAS